MLHIQKLVNVKIDFTVSGIHDPFSESHYVSEDCWQVVIADAGFSWVRGALTNKSAKVVCPIDENSETSSTVSVARA
jgi:hypothetical protein